MRPLAQHMMLLPDPQLRPPERQEAGREVMADNGTSEDPAKARRFRDAALPHLDAVYTLARYLLRNPADAEDAVQECYLRALRHFDTIRGPAIKPWLLAILRNVCRAEYARRSVVELYDVKAEAADKSKDADRKSTRLNSSHDQISYAVFCLKKKNTSTLSDRRWESIRPLGRATT